MKTLARRHEKMRRPLEGTSADPGRCFWTPGPRQQFYRLKGISKTAHHASVSTPKMAQGTDKPARAETTPKQARIALIK
jgi:hypothetical protein